MGKWAGLLILVCHLILAAAMGNAAPAAPQTQFNFAVLGDRTEDADEAVFEQILSEIANLDPSFLVSIGDLIQGYTSDSALVEGEWNEVLDLLDATGIEYHLTTGNHDIFDAQSAAIYRTRFGSPDKFFRFMDRAFITFDVSAYGTADAIPSAKIDWLVRVLEVSKKSKGIFVFYHRPFWCEDFSAGRENRLHNIFKNYPIKAVFTGHYHRYFHTVRDGIQYFGVPSSGGALPPGGRDRGCFYGYMLVHVRGESLSVNLVEPGIFKPVDTVTFEDGIKMAEVDAKAVQLGELLAYDYRMSSVGQVTITIENPGHTTLTDTARWVLRGDWAVQPIKDYVEVPPDEVGKLTAFVRCDGYLFPVPIVELHLPCCDGRIVDVVKPLNVKRVTYADLADSMPVIDGVLNEPVWRGIAGETHFFGPQGGRSPTDSTVLRVCYDSTNVYLAAECFDSKIGELRAMATERDASAADDDAVSFVFQPRRDSETFYQVSVNPIGTLFDRRVEVCPFGTYVSDPTWDVVATVATKVLSDRWVVEIAIPLAGLDGAAAGESRWGFNFSRIEQRLRTTALFQAPLRYRSDGIGIMGFR
ncbi:MAG TPA: metallophosphoesterase [bacterium]|nr:metallophosphoesterase [bacterium]